MSSTLSNNAKNPIIPDRYGDVPIANRKFWNKNERIMPSDHDEIGEIEIVGTIPIKSGRLLVTDPCYEKFLGQRIWCTIEIDVVPHDKYEVRIAKSVSTIGNWDDYMWVGVYHPDYKDAIPTEVAHDDVGVDSATLSLSDADHKVAFKSASSLSSDDMNEIITNFHGMDVVRITTDDGGYPVLVARNENDKIIAVEVLLY